MKHEHLYYVYILTNINNRRFYIGITSNLLNRCYEHKDKKDPGSFTGRYNINRLVHFEIYGDVNAAINREKELKGWRKEKKINLIKSGNAMFRDLIDDLSK